jgi:hypothetical protein
LAVDAGYIRALPEKEGVRNLAIVTSKLVRPVARHGYTHAYVGSCNPHQGTRQQAFLTMLHVPQDAPVTVLSDGGDDVAFACKLPRPTERVLDWFHMAMRFEHLRTAVQGLRLEPGYGFMRRWLCARVDKAKWLLWHGRQHECLRRLESLRRDTGWGGFRNPLGSLIRYIESYPDWLIDYGKRYRQHRPISTGGAESAVEYVVDQRMKNKGHMRWSRQGANALLQVRCAVLNGIDMLNVMRWYPRDRKHAFPTAPRVG